MLFICFVMLAQLLSSNPYALGLEAMVSRVRMYQHQLEGILDP